MKKHHALLIGLSIPILMITIIMASIFWPKQTHYPKYDFIYSSGNFPVAWSLYQINQGKIVPTDLESASITPDSHEKLFLYDSMKKSTFEVSYQQLKAITIIPNQVSPDGFKVESASQQSMAYPWPFLTTRNNSIRYLLGPSYSQKLNLQFVDSNPSNFLFLGWISHEQATDLTQH